MADRIKVLILEERQADAELAAHQLREADFEPDWQRVDNESDYLSSLDQEFDVILSDYNLPRFDGLKALRLLQSRDLDTSSSGSNSSDNVVKPRMSEKKVVSFFLLEAGSTSMFPARIELATSGEKYRVSRLA